MNSGEITGFIGRRGDRKTTIIKSMLNLVHFDSGGILHFGMAIAENNTEIKKSIGYSTDSITWYPRKKINDIVKVVKRFYGDWDEDAYFRYLEMFVLDDNKTALELSEGMKTECNLLIALSHHAKVLILDEPTSGLDPFHSTYYLETVIRKKRFKNIIASICSDTA